MPRSLSGYSMAFYWPHPVQQGECENYFWAARRGYPGMLKKTFKRKRSISSHIYVVLATLASWLITNEFDNFSIFFYLGQDDC